jgi:hypothetical protein
MGIELSENFNLPYLAGNPSDFWKRWHISLSTWLKDYIYIPLGGNRDGLLRQNINLMIVWILGGLWHGSTYSYFLWGVYCGLQVVVYSTYKYYFKKEMLVYANKLNQYRNRLFKIIGIIITVYLFVMGLLLFRIEDTEHLSKIIQNGNSIIFFDRVLYLKIIILILLLGIVDFLKNYKETWLNFKVCIYHIVLYFILFPSLMIIYTLVYVLEKTEFLYFKF